MKHKPTQSYTELRRFMEKWTWTDPLTGKQDIGYVHPQTAINVQRVPFKIKFLTKTGHVDEGICVCTSVDTVRHQRRVQFVDSKQTRWVNDILVMEVDGTRFLRQVQVVLGLHFDVSVGFYMLDLPLGDEMTAEIIRQNPILGGGKGMNFVPTTNRLLK